MVLGAMCGWVHRTGLEAENATSEDAMRLYEAAIVGAVLGATLMILVIIIDWSRRD